MVRAKGRPRPMPAEAVAAVSDRRNLLIQKPAARDRRYRKPSCPNAGFSGFHG